MKNNFFLIIALLIITIFYLLEPIPYCKLQKDFVEDEGFLLHGNGDSMYPTILNNSECLCVEKERYFVGNIVLFIVEIDGEFEKVLHRIIEINGDEIHTKGDNNYFIDKLITEQDIICSIPIIHRYKTLF